MPDLPKDWRIIPSYSGGVTMVTFLIKASHEYHIVVNKKVSLNRVGVNNDHII